MISKSLSIAAGAAAVGFIGYCVYFDHKRRSDPDFRKKLKESRFSTCALCLVLRIKNFSNVFIEVVSCLFWSIFQ